MYIAIIADVVSSRQIKDRNAFQTKLNEVLETINRDYAEDIASKFTITLGDEFQGLLKKPDRLLRIVTEIKWALTPVKARFGIGFGEIQTAINPEASIGADGPAYHLARQMIQEIRATETGKHAMNCNLMLAWQGGSPVLTAINGGLRLMAFLESDWTEKQRANVMDSYLGGLNQSQIADKRQLNQSTVQRSLVGAGYYEYEFALRTFQNSIDSLWEER